MRTGGVLFGIFLAASGLSACDEYETITGTSNTSDPTRNYSQSETVIAVTPMSDRVSVTVAYNDETGEDGTFIEYTPTTRKVKRGASLMGWSYSPDGGDTFTIKGKLRPPAGWSILWGDPAIASVRNPYSATVGLVYLTNIASPDDRFPAGGHSGYIGDVLAGACIARSWNGGQTFSHVQCVRDGNHFYDGAAMAVSRTGRACAAYNDVDEDSIDVWCQNGLLTSFKLVPNPFPGQKIVTHPRLRADDDGNMYLMAMRACSGGRGQLILAKWNGTSWTSPVSAGACDGAVYPQFNLGGRMLRTGPQFSFDIRNDEMVGSDAIRVVYTHTGSDGRHHLKGNFCSASALSCWDGGSGWTTDASTGHQFNPKIDRAPRRRNERGEVISEEIWKVVFYNDDLGGTNQISVKQGNLAVLPDQSRVFVPFELVPKHEVCSDTRGYWGDYDEVKFVQFREPSKAAQFIVTGSDSSRGCNLREAYRSRYLHISKVLF